MRPLRACGVPVFTATFRVRLARAAAALLTLCSTVEAAAQPSPTTGALERFEPSVPGDAMLGVASPAVGGHLVPRGAIVGSYAYRPLSIQDGDTRSVVVSDQLFLHAAFSLALFNRVLLSADMPIALAQGGENPTVANVNFASPTGVEAGDLRVGARLRLWGDYWDPFQIGVGGHVQVPTAPAGSYSGDGSVRGSPQLLVGGRSDHVVYSLSLGTTLRSSARPHTFDARAGAALVLGDSFFQIGPEVSVSAPFTEDVVLDNEQAKIAIASPVAAELLLGAKLRFLKSFVIGAGAGPGLTQGWGTPVFAMVGSLGYDPQPEKQPDSDTDRDGIMDPQDACVTVPGVRSDDPKKNGCPPDTDGDGIVDPQDACVTVPGVKSDDPKKNGCPPDTDGDGIVDPQDACVTVPGVKSDDPKKNGCPPDTDGDGIVDPQDACVTVPGVKSDDPKKNGCPPDTDGDGIADAQDACPKEPGSPDPDPKKHGCPHVEVTSSEIVITRQIQFKFGKSSLDQTVDPVSDDLLTEVRDAIVKHPEIKQIEVQGHADVVGPEEYNLTLSQARANAVRDWLVRKGVPSAKLSPKGYGSKVPRASNDTDQGRQENRRVQFVIVKQDLKP
ncbi:MAG: OmpA family protein [Polyangiaceae bacterium]|nr:OmpA family protein [Polyangiaceae bacterium]